MHYLNTNLGVVGQRGITIAGRQRLTTAQVFGNRGEGRTASHLAVRKLVSVCCFKTTVEELGLISNLHCTGALCRRERLGMMSTRSRADRFVVAAGGTGPSSEKLLIVGPGVLGSCLGSLWLREHGANSVVGQTNSTTNHENLRMLGIVPRTNADAKTLQKEKFPFVLFAAPPSGSEDYVGDVKEALELWDKTGAFVFTSSAAVYDVEDGSWCDESAPVVPKGKGERTDRLLMAEDAVLEAGGCVVRLVGLYHRSRGAHTFFLKQGEVARWGGYTVNLIHYEDAAGITAAILSGQGNESGSMYRGRIFLGCDGEPLTFRQMMDSIESSGVLSGHVEFTGTEGPVKGKCMTNEATKQQLQWNPKYKSFKEFFLSGGKDWYCTEGEGAVAPAGYSHA